MIRIYFVLFICLPSILFAQTAKELDSIVSQCSKVNYFHGAVLVAKDGNIVLNKGYGFADASLKMLTTVNTIFQIGSVTKQFTAAAIMKLAEQKKLSVTDKVGKFFPELKGGDKISIHQLLTHRSGLYNYTNDTSLWYGKLTKEKLIAYINKSAPESEPGTKMSYNNTGYALLGYLIEKLSGKKYEDYIRTIIFKPLKMSSSGFDFTSVASSKKAKGYYDNGTAYLAARSIDSTVSYSAGAIYSTTSNMLQWSQAILKKKIITPASWKLMTTNYGDDYGYGLILDSVHGEKNIWHNGGLDGFVTTFYNLPAQNITVVVLSNYMQANTIGVADFLVAAMLGKPYELPKVRSEAVVNADSLKQYIGTYQLAPTFSITITVVDGKLMAQATGQQNFQLYYEKKDSFFYKVVDAQVKFERAADGAVKSLTLYQNGMELRGEKTK